MNANGFAAAERPARRAASSVVRTTGVSTAAAWQIVLAAQAQQLDLQLWKP
jgi:hypothetical protein